MINRRIYLTAIFCITILLVMFLINSSRVYAAGPNFLVSWKAEDYAPAGYLGKILPVNQTKIDVSFELIGNNPSDNGKIVDLSGNEVRWYVNGNLMSQSNGRKTFSFVTNDENNADTSVRISADYSDSSAGYSYFVDDYIDISLSAPDIVVVYKNYNLYLSKGNNNFFSAIPYFFNSTLDNLKASWTVNDQSVDPGSDQWDLGVTLGDNYPSGSDIKISAIVQDIFNATSAVSRTFHFISR